MSLLVGDNVPVSLRAVNDNTSYFLMLLHDYFLLFCKLSGEPHESRGGHQQETLPKYIGGPQQRPSIHAHQGLQHWACWPGASYSGERRAAPQQANEVQQLSNWVRYILTASSTAPSVADIKEFCATHKDEIGGRSIREKTKSIIKSLRKQ